MNKYYCPNCKKESSINEIYDNIKIGDLFLNFETDQQEHLVSVKCPHCDLTVLGSVRLNYNKSDILKLIDTEFKFQKKEHIEQCPKCLDMTIISEDIDAEFCYPVNREKTVFKVTCNSGGGIGCGLFIEFKKNDKSIFDTAKEIWLNLDWYLS